MQIEGTFLQNAMYFRYAPLTSVEVERSSSKLKMILNTQRISFKTEDIKKQLIISCNHLIFN